MAPREKSRRSLFVELLSTAAGTWVAVSGLLGLASAASGCGTEPVEKYGGPPMDGGSEGPVVKYGGPPDVGSERPVTKYGGWDTNPRPQDGRTEQPVVKYGGPGDMRHEQPVVKYGGLDMRKEGLSTKYGGPFVG